MSIVCVTSSPLRQFRLKRLDARTNVTSCATDLSSGFIGFPSVKEQGTADACCKQAGSMFTFNTETGQLSIGTRVVTRIKSGWLRASENTTLSSKFYLKPEYFSYWARTDCFLCRTGSIIRG